MGNRRQALSALIGLTIVIGVVFFYIRHSSLTFDNGAWETYSRSSLVSLKQGDLSKAMKNCLEAMRLIRKHRIGDMRLVKSYMLLAEIYRWQNEYDQAEEVFSLAVRSCEEAYGPNDRAMIIPLESLANFYYYSKVDYKQVGQLYDRVLEIIKYNDPDNHSDLAIRASNVAQVYVLMEESEKAERYHQLALDHARENAKLNAKSGQIDLSNYLLISAGFYNSRRKCEEALSLSEEALNLRHELVDRSDSLANSKQDTKLDLVVALDALGQIYADCGEFTRAEKAYLESVAVIEEIRGENHSDLLIRLNGLATALLMQKKYDEAERCYQRIFQIISKNNLQEFPEIKPLLKAYEKFEGREKS